MGPFSAIFRDRGLESPTREWNFSQNIFLNKTHSTAFINYKELLSKVVDRASWALPSFYAGMLADLILKELSM